EPLPPPIPDVWFEDAELTPPPKDASDEPLPEPLRLPVPGENDEPIPAPKPVVKPLGGSESENEPLVLRVAGEEESAAATSETEADGEQAGPRKDRWAVPQKSALLRRK
ncbi:MAG TPA: hypothetical protein VG433_06635, partial [Pirellulales bacterium]|nr:hypothetical protein [Pirellulales bacterium]